MKNRHSSHINSIILPCVFYSIIAGAITGAVIFLFKLAAEHIIDFSASAYSFVRANPGYLPLLLLGCALLGIIAALLLKYSKSSRGGGIPTSVALLRGLITFKWLRSVIILPISAMLSYLAGLPLGNEGPSVQMGTALGKGTSSLFAKKNKALDRYIMTGGACAGFASATGAPVSGIFFALEEAHLRFTPMLITVASSAVISGGLVMNGLCTLFGKSSSLFHFELFPALPIKYIWVAAASGIICGICAAAFTKIYTFINHLLKEQLGKIPFIVKMICLFLIAGIIGFISADCLGSGHSLVDVLVEHGNVWYVLLAVLLIRVLLLVFANNIGATGGLFIPTLCFGAIIGSIISGFITSCGFIPQSHYSTIVILSIVAFLSAFVRTPVTAVIFSIEALGSVNNILPAIVAVTAAYITIEFTSVECFYETVIHSRVKLENMGKSSSVIDEKFTVEHGAFIVGKELRDILWPPKCIVLSVKRSESGKAHSSGPIQAGDVLHIHADTSDTGKTLEDLRNILGKD